MQRRLTSLLTAMLVIGALVPASANEYTDVIDAFDNDNGDPFDISLDIGYSWHREGAQIRRESTTPGPDGMQTTDFYNYIDMFKYVHVWHQLDFELDIGIYEDVAIYVAMPLVLSDTRQLSGETGLLWPGGQQLFANDFKSPDRSGIDHVAAGLKWNILDQSRDDTKPNWQLHLAGRFAVGTPLQAACDKSQQVLTAGGTAELCDVAAQPTEGGISRGVNEIIAGTKLSRRYGVVDPFFGVEVIAGFPRSDSAYKAGTNLGAINSRPPLVGGFDFGLELIPWEVVEAERKLVIGLAMGGAYHSEGREYTPLFDAIGTSGLLQDTEVLARDINGDGDTLDGGETPEANYEWTGLTDVENYATFDGGLYLAIQPAKYIKFKLGGGVTHVTEHFITKTDECTGDGLSSDGICVNVNWDNRPVLDSPGNRYRAESTMIWNVAIDLTAQF